MMKKKMVTTDYLNLLLSSLLVLQLYAFVSVGAITGNSIDAEQLMSFKASLPNPQILSDWQSGQDPCLFARVSCSTELRVTSLDLSFLALASDFNSVSTHLLPIENLASLTLKSTNLAGKLRVSSACSSSLTYLDLSLNSLSGDPSDLAVFSACSALTSLNLSSNSIEGNSGNWHYSLKLQTLDLSSNRISGGAFLPWLLSSGCPHLTSLTLKGNKLEGSFSLNGCDLLQKFDVSSNNFSTAIPNFGSCAQLNYLDLSSNKFTGSIGDEFSACDELAYLNISNNHFSGLIPSFPTSNLQFLYLSGNQFEGGFSKSIAESCSSLMELDFSSNHLSGNLPTTLESCSSLTVFDVSYNNFSGELPVDMFMKMDGLKKLSLAANLFAGVLPDSLPLKSSLESLDWSSNSISGRIPSGLCQNQNSSLKELYLEDNQLTGQIPSDLSNCSKLVSLDLSFNYLTGKIPPNLGFLSNLKDLIIWMNLLEGQIPQELMYIGSLENLILDYNRLTGTIPSGLKNCTNLNWISLSSNRLSGVIPSWIGSLANLAILKLSNNSFYGEIPPELGDCKSLLWLDLNSNFLNGSIPSTLSKQSGSMAVGLVVGKKYVYLRNDGNKECHGAGNLLEFAGIRQDSLNRIPSQNSCNFTRIYRGNTQPTFQHNGSMIFLDLSFNMLGGSIPKEIGSMYYLYVLDFAHNALSGPIPSEMGGLKYVGIMDLSYNRLSGQIPPSLAGLTLLTEIDLSNNNLSGMIPDSGQFETFPANRFYNNSGLCGYPLSKCGTASSSSASQHQRRRRHGTVAGSVALGLLFSLICIFGIIIVYVELQKRKNKKKKDSISNEFRENNANSNSAWKFTSNREALSINLAAFEKPLRKLTFADLLEATNGFHNDSMIGSGGFGDVYKAKLKDGTTVAIKKLIQVSGQGDREFTAEMETIGKIKHRNLVPLLGYCKVGDERLLVYEYMLHGSLEDVLHDRKKGIRLDWATRRKVAIGAARGLAFLHHNCIPHIIHRDMKSSNVLLDESLEARVSDFGMARLMSAMDTHLSVSTLAGTPGYVPPEYYQSFRCSTKGDVYSYGVVLLELLTGKKPTDSDEFGEDNLVGWVRKHAKTRISDVFDKELVMEDPCLEVELLEHLKVACACLDDRPWRRPTMIQVMAMFKEIQAGSGLDSRSSIGIEDHGVEMTIKEDVEMGKL